MELLERIRIMLIKKRGPKRVSPAEAKRMPMAS
jgi:hypothetical protein